MAAWWLRISNSNNQIIDPDIADQFSFPASAISQVDIEHEGREEWIQFGIKYASFIHRVTTPPYARYLTYGTEDLMDGDALVSQPQRREEPVYVRWVNDDFGFGGFANKDFEAGEPVAIYSGNFCN